MLIDTLSPFFRSFTSFSLTLVLTVIFFEFSIVTTTWPGETKLSFSAEIFVTVPFVLVNDEEPNYLLNAWRKFDSE